MFSEFHVDTSMCLYERKLKHSDIVYDTLQASDTILIDYHFFSGPLIENFTFPAFSPMTMFQTVPDTSSYVKVRQHRPYDQVILNNKLGHQNIFCCFH